MTKINKIASFEEAKKIFQCLEEKFPSCLGKLDDLNPTGWVIVPKGTIKEGGNMDLYWIDYFAFRKGSEAKAAYKEFFDEEEFVCTLVCAQDFSGASGLAAFACTAERVCKNQPEKLAKLMHRYE